MVDLAKPRTPWKRYSFIVAGILLLCAPLGYIGVRVYRKWEPKRLAVRAEAFLEKKDYKSAILTTRRGLTINPNNPDCYRVLAKIAEKFGSPDAVSLRQRVAAILPKSPEASLDLAETAMRFGELGVAGQALAGIGESEKQKARYQTDLGALAVARNQWDAAAKAYEKVLKIDPTNANLQFQFASAQLHGNRPEDLEAGRITLNRLKEDERFRVAALRLLFDDAVASGKHEEALRLGRDLQADPQSAFDDKVTFLNLLQTMKAADFSSFFESLKAAALNDNHAMATLLVWMIRNGKAAEALKWMPEFSEKLTSSTEVNAILALCYLSIRDWAGLERFATDANWQEFDYRVERFDNDPNWQEFEYLRLALLARAERELGHKEGSVLHWRAAAALAITQPSRTKALLQMAMEWGWDREAQDLLTLVANPTDSERAALVTLYQHFARNRDTQGLFESSEEMVRLSPKDDRLRNDYVMYSLLLKHHVVEARAMSKELYERHRSDPAYISTYAFALYANADFENALKIMNTLSADQLKTPELAGYYAVILSENGQNDEAMKFFEFAKDGKFLPEEEKLIEHSRP